MRTFGWSPTEGDLQVEKLFKSLVSQYWAKLLIELGSFFVEKVQIEESQMRILKVLRKD